MNSIIKIVVVFKKKALSFFPLVAKHAIIYEYNLIELNHLASEPLPDGYKFKMVDEVPTQMLSSFSDTNREQGQFARTILPNLQTPQVSKGLCIVYLDKEIASLGWVYFCLSHLNVKEHYPISKSVFYPMDGFVAKIHRGKGLHRRCVAERFAIAKKTGKHLGYGIVFFDNAAAIKDNDRLGKRIGVVFKLIGSRIRFNLYIPSRLHLYLLEHT